MNEFKPNFTQVPNIIFDELLSDLTDAELRCLMYICRRTYGFHRDSDKISYSQFESGIEGKDTGCGLRREAVASGLKSLEERGVISRERDGNSVDYRINLEFDYRTSSSSATEPQPVRLPNIQNKEKEREIKIHASVHYLLNLPDLTVSELVEKYKVSRSEVIAEGETAYNWITSKGKTYKNYDAMFRNWLKRSFGLREVPTSSSKL